MPLPFWSITQPGAWLSTTRSQTPTVFSLSNAPTMRPVVGSSATTTATIAEWGSEPTSWSCDRQPRSWGRHLSKPAGQHSVERFLHKPLRQQGDVLPAHREQHRQELRQCLRGLGPDNRRAAHLLEQHRSELFERLQKQELLQRVDDFDFRCQTQHVSWPEQRSRVPMGTFGTDQPVIRRLAGAWSRQRDHQPLEKRTLCL